MLSDSDNSRMLQMLHINERREFMIVIAVVWWYTIRLRWKVQICTDKIKNVGGQERILFEYWSKQFGCRSKSHSSIRSRLIASCLWNLNHFWSVFVFESTVLSMVTWKTRYVMATRWVMVRLQAGRSYRIFYILIMIDWFIHSFIHSFSEIYGTDFICVRHAERTRARETLSSVSVPDSMIDSILDHQISKQHTRTIVSIVQ